MTSASDWIKQEFDKLQQEFIENFTAGGNELPNPNTAIAIPNGGSVTVTNSTAEAFHPSLANSSVGVSVRNPRVGEVLVVDIYHGDNVQDFGKVKDFGIVGIIHKASQGGSIVDQMYATRRKEAISAGLLFGAYHFYDFSAEPESQADHFLSVADVDSNTLVALDWENVGNKEPSAALAHAFLTRIETKLGRKAVIYSGNVAKEQLKGIDPYFGSHKLWLCQYGKTWKTQQSWQYPFLWQNSETGAVPGITGHVDINTIVSPMSVDLLRKQWAT